MLVDVSRVGLRMPARIMNYAIFRKLHKFWQPNGALKRGLLVNKFYLWPLLLMLYANAAFASDFMVLWVGLACIAVFIVNVALGVTLCLVIKRDTSAQRHPHLAIMIFVSLIALAIVADEAKHMSSVDTVGMILLIVSPVLVAGLVAARMMKRMRCITTEGEDN